MIHTLLHLVTNWVVNVLPLGKTLEDVQKETRLRIEFLLGIENADINAFPAPSFIAGYVRILCNSSEFKS